MLFKEFKDVFAWTYKDLKGIPLELAQHIIELDTSKPLAHQTRYKFFYHSPWSFVLEMVSIKWGRTTWEEETGITTSKGQKKRQYEGEVH